MSNENILLMPFLDESESFVHGFECGKLWNLMEEGECVERQLIHSTNIKQIEMMADTFGIIADIEIIDGTWAYLTIKSTTI